LVVFACWHKHTNLRIFMQAFSALFSDGRLS
jgi:hypothetical protein